MSFSNVKAEETQDGFSTEPGTDFYESEFQKSDEIDLFGDQDLEVLIEQLDDEEVVLEEEALEITSDNEARIQSFSLSSNDISAANSNLTMGFLQPTAGTGINGNIYNGSKSSTAVSYIAADVKYTGVIPFLEKKDGRYRIVIAGLEGWVDETGFRPYAIDTKNLRVNHYTPDANGRLFHWISRAAVNPPVSQGGATYSYDSIGVGKTPSFMKAGKDYFSSDGHYFYENTVTMLNDYKNGTRKNSINPNNPHYNYFQFLSYRTASNITAADLEGYLKNVKGYTSVPTSTGSLTANQSMLVGAASSFINNGAEYGANALMTFSLAINESGWGRSNLAINKKNLFGHSAYDSDPNAATGYKDVSEGILYHNQYYINSLYSNVNSSISKGTYFGDKSSGMNIHYASDPHWGEKAADNYYALNVRLGEKDSNKAEIGLLKNGVSEGLVRKEATTKSPSLYSLKVKNQAVNIIGQVNGESVSGSTVWYKISSDALLDANRNVSVASGKVNENKYLKDKNYAFVHSSIIDKVNDLGNGGTPSLPRGDVDGNGLVQAVDYMLIKNHIMDKGKLSGDRLSRADLNGDGNITAVDYMVIKNIIMGR